MCIFVCVCVFNVSGNNRHFLFVMNFFFLAVREVYRFCLGELTQSGFILTSSQDHYALLYQRTYETSSHVYIFVHPRL